MLPADVPLKRLVAVLVVVGLVLVLAGLAANTEQLWFAPVEVDLPERVVADEGEIIERSGTPGGGSQDSPMPGWVSAGLLIAIIAVLFYLMLQHMPRVSLAALAKHRRAKTREVDEPTEAERDDEIIRVTTDLIDDLSLEGDPRAAIQRAYAAVETGFGSRELARKPAETPLRYLQRVFGRHLDKSGPLQQLTGLFETARFSTRPVTEEMRTEAIEAVSEIREHYRSRRRGRVR